PALCGFLFVQVERFPYQKVVIMNVPSSELLEYGMQIIYDTIRERKSQLDEQKQKRKVRLQGDAIALMSEFKQSLLLPDGIPSGSSGIKLSYVRTFVKSSDGMKTERPLQGVQLNGAHQLVFTIDLLVSEHHPNGEWVSVDVEMWYEESTLTVAVLGRKRRHITVTGPDVSGRFYEAAALIKETMMDLLTDDRLN
ncbi:hypothetical protein N5M43_005870, partial [Klebsiella pneumoniae]